MKGSVPVENRNIPGPFGSPSYHSQVAPVPKVPPLTVKSTVPAPHKTKGAPVNELGSVEAVLTVTVNVFEITSEQFIDFTSLLKHVDCVIPLGASKVALIAPPISVQVPLHPMSSCH